MDENREKDSKNSSIDERVHQQLVYKDNRIIDLNNVILDKERQILDLQERVREHNEVNTVKNQAMRIVQQKFEEMNRDKKDMSTETDPGLLYSQATSSSSSKNQQERRARSSSPGHVIASRKSVATTSSGTFSPPPIDPLFDPHSKLSALPDIDGIHRKHQRKRVTFDLNPNAPMTSSSRHLNSTSESIDHLEIQSENGILRQQLGEMTSSLEKLKSEFETEVIRLTKEAKTAGLKAKVAATARCKELEAQLEDVNGRFGDENERLQEEVATLRSSRNWEIEQNGHLRDQVAHLKEKSFKLTEELDASEKAKRSLDSEVDESKKLMELMVDDLLQAENAINYHVNQKTAIFEDIDRLKEAIIAQDRFIEILEADIVIYEQHIGLLRENLGASQIDHRALIKSKAFETKLLALEKEKEQIDKKSNEDRLKTKALDKKCRVLVEQNEQLMARLCELEMSHGGADETKSRKMADQDERIRQISSALESERDVSQRLREAKEGLEKELMTKRKQEEQSQNRRQMDVEMTRMEAQNKIDEMSVEVDSARRKVNDVMAEVEQLRATNFDLQMHIETAKRTMEELADSNEQLEKQIEKVEEDNEEKDEDLKQSTWDVETLTRQNEALSPDFRVELDGVRQGFHETRELSEEVKQLKQELQRQQDVHRAQFEAACDQLEEEDDAPRKTSLEVQQEQYILAYEQQIEQISHENEALKRELELKNGPVQRKTTGILEPPRLEEMIQQIHTTSQSFVTSSGLSEAPTSSGFVATSSESFAMASAPSEFSTGVARAHEQLKREIDELKRKNQDFTEKMKRLELEAKLSGELNVELGRAMLELEEHNDLLQKEQEAVKADDVATGRELELHVMMVQEMTEQIAGMQERIDEMEEKKREKEQEVEQLRGEATASAQETQRVNQELERLLHNLAESEIARKDEFDNANATHDAEIREFSQKMEDSRRDIADLEAKLQEAERKLAETYDVRETAILTKAVAPESSFRVAPEVMEAPVAFRQLQGAQNWENLAQNAPESVYGAPGSSESSSVVPGAQFAPNLAPEAPGPISPIPPAPEAHFAPILAQNAPNLTTQAPESAPGAQFAPESPEDSPELHDQLQNVSRDMNKLIELKDELEIAIQALKAEIWSLNGQLKASILDREALEDKITELDDQVEKEKKKAISLDVELQEQVDLTERAVRRAAEAENESNQRMAECLEKETRREEIEQAYTRLNEYYQQLQEAYNTIYAQLAASQTNPDAPMTSSSPPEDVHVSGILDGLLTMLLIVRDPAVSMPIQEKLEKVGEKVKRLLEEYDENQKALEEQKRITVALEARLQNMETSTGESATTRDRIEQLEGEIEWKEEECEALKRRIKDLEKALEAVAQRTEDETEAARLTTRQADVDSLFRTNAELAHTSVRLQNEVDEMDELKQKILEEKEQLEQHIKELELQVAELMEQHEAHLQQTPILTVSPDSAHKLQESEKEVVRLSAIEKTLNNRILALEDQNLELEEKVQEIEEELAENKAEIAKKPAETENWDDWNEPGETSDGLEEAKSEISRLLDVEKALTMRMEMLKLHNEQLEQKVKEQEMVPKPSEATPQQAETATSSAPEDDDWGWGEDQETQSEPSKSENPELQEAKTEVIRLTQIEKILNNRILALEEQNLELEERLQEMEEELAEKDKSLAENAPKPAENASGWDDWEEKEAEPKSESDDVTGFQKTISELQEKVQFQKEVIEKAETELMDIQDKYDDLESAYQHAQQASTNTEQLTENLQSLKLELDQAHREKSTLQANLDQILTEKEDLEEKIRELLAKNQESDGWNDDGWGEEKDEKKDDEELQNLRESHQTLTDRIAELDAQNAQIQSETAQKLAQITAEKLKIEQKLAETLQELDDVTAKGTSGWTDEWTDQGEIEKMRETQTVLEMKIEALNEELLSVKEREMELIDQNAFLQSRLIALQSDLDDVTKQLSDAQSAGWNDDDDAWNQNSEDVKLQLESELSARNSEISQLKTQLESMESLKSELKSVQDQNGLLKDSEARLLDHSDEFAIQMDKYKAKCGVLEAKVIELQVEIEKKETEKADSDELVTLRQQLSTVQLEHRSQLSARDDVITQLRQKIQDLQKTIEDLQSKLKTFATARRQAPRMTSTSSSGQHHHQNPSSRPDSRLSTSSRASSFVPEAVSNPIQTTGSAFDVVVPQSGEPLRRRNK